MLSLLKSCVIVLITATSLVHLSVGSKCRCQSNCEADVRDCYKSAGYTFGTVKTDENTPRAILSCNSKFSKCTTECQPTCRKEF